MKRLITCICILIIVASCELTSLTKSSGGRQEPSAVIPRSQETSTDTLTVFLTGNMLGSLKPCGCSGGQLGGLDRRTAVFNSVPENKRLIIDTGSIVEKRTKQNEIKFQIIIQAFMYLDYDIVNFRRQDIEIARILDLLDSSSIGLISSYETDEQIPAGNQYKYILNGEYINISVVAFDPEEVPLEYISEVFPSESGQKNVNILILNNYSEEIIPTISQMGIVDCLVCPIQSDEPTIIGNQDAKPLVCSVGRYGRYIGKLEIKNSPDGDIKLTFEDIPVKEEIEPDAGLKALYETYRDIVKVSNLLLEDKPNYPPDDNLKYIGSESCYSESSDCHQYEHVMWLLVNKNHSQAYATLEQEGSQYDPECIVCHVVGYKYISGFVSEEKTPYLKNVGCEICHGPGSAHYDNPYENPTKPPIPLNEIDLLCGQCHTPEHSGDFAGNEEEYLQKINHWPEPNDINNVK